MLQRLSELPHGVQALDALGVVTGHDYDEVFTPLVDQVTGTGTRLRLLYRCGPEFRRLTAGALWADARLGLRYLPILDGCAVVTDKGWIRGSTRGIGSWMPCPVRVFPDEETERALDWLGSLPARSGTTPRAIVRAYIGGVTAGIGGFAATAIRIRRPSDRKDARRCPPGP
ncbi:STAS/SEC14 domain-containing protein [Sciscionella sediminilitoris]|uniref:STAS/SEC14 domain-containing protein n=1 Tax=Sciscionella sediminilitoris TaxID=1445613 RepID=UPI0009EB0BD5|nr:STAS/SEC14 domain-containing protein [Sciscionella sp. SE31]